MSKITACVDGRDLSLTEGSGIATYGRNLLTTLAKLGANTQVLYGPQSPISREAVLNEIALVGPASNGGKPTRLKRFFHTARARYGLPAYPVARQHVIWPRDGAAPPRADAFWASPYLYQTGHRSFVKSGRLTEVKFRSSEEIARPDVCHWTSVIPLHGKGAVNIYTMHDLIPLILPHLSLSDKTQYLKVCRAIAAKADHIIVGSESAKTDIMAILGVEAGRITNTYHAIDLPAGHMERPDEEVARELDAAFGLEWKGYFLHYGTIEPRKNLGRVVEAYLASGVSTPLVVVGGPGWMSEPETTLLNQAHKVHGAASRIHQYEYMSYSMLVSLIRGTKGVLFPSLYEGFGLPVLEAMSLGAPVLTSDQGSLPEVAGDAALQVDPYDVQAISRGIRMLDKDPDWRADATQRGRVQAAKFSQSAYQERLRDLYAKVGVSS